MDAMSAILSRRSIRQYTNKPVARESVYEVLQAAMNAPSAGNERPWHFIVLTERRVLDEIPKFHPYSAMLKQASAAILVCADLSLEKQKGCLALDCSAATENILIAAHAKGLGAVWCGVYPTEDRMANLRKLLRLPDAIMPFSLVPIGFPAEIRRGEDRYDASRVHWNEW
ncbi:MAG TPA: nitroreductase family protein [Nitrospirota bacterium]|nr:nitroreductase family protein [Nitrospirota bacterium]